MLTAVTGALAGLFHVLAGPDHLAAVGPLALDGRRRGWLAGWTWGSGTRPAWSWWPRSPFFSATCFHPSRHLRLE